MTALQVADAEAAEVSAQLVVLHVGNNSYAVPISRVQEIIRLPEITPLPEAEAFVEGLINLRGRVLPVVDLATRLGAGKTEPSKTARVVVAHVGEGQKNEVGLMVQAVSRVLRVNRSDVEPASEMAIAGGRGILGVAKLADELILLLDLDAALAGVEAAAEVGAASRIASEPEGQ
ncbi:MAG: chemotaxis protein CheW [Chloroflexota bacterium]|nr:chemotaxis protein CheW [Chloroflexota bacterium]